VFLFFFLVLPSESLGFISFYLVFLPEES